MANKREDDEQFKAKYESYGKTAFLDGTNLDDCPYKKGDRRLHWMVGWLDARTEQKYPQKDPTNRLISR